MFYMKFLYTFCYFTKTTYLSQNKLVLIEIVQADDFSKLIPPTGRDQLLEENGEERSEVPSDWNLQGSTDDDDCRIRQRFHESN